MATLMEYGAVAAGTALPMVTRATLDGPGSALFRPSVLAGLGLGVVALGYGWFARSGDLPAIGGSRSEVSNFSALFGAAATTGGVLSALVPSSGSDFALPSA